MSSCEISGFAGVNNMQDISSLDQPKLISKSTDFTGMLELASCVNFDIDDNGGLLDREEPQEIFSKPYSAKFTQVLKGRKYTVANNKLHYTMPWSDEKDPRRSVITYPASITMIQEVEEGMWVSTTEKIYYHKGSNPTELNEFSQSIAYNFPAIMGTGEKIAASKLGLQKGGFVAVFATTFGICVGDDAGVVTNLSEARFSYTPAMRGVSMISEKNGMIRYLVKFIGEVGESYNQQPALQLDVDEQ